jgi:ketosteroid isomerase-like protein
MQDDEMRTMARACYHAYATGDRSILDRVLADDFRFSSPYDDDIDKAEYFARCWPNHDRIAAHHIQSITVNGDAAFVFYICALKSGARFRNIERFVFDRGRISRIEVYFGDAPIGMGKRDYLALIEHARSAKAANG